MKAADVAISDLQRDKTALEETLRQLRQQRQLCLEQHDHDGAKKCFELIHETLEKDRALLRQQEAERQQVEFQRLKRATGLVVERNREEWGGVLQQAERRWDHKRHALREKHKLEMDNFKAQLETRTKSKLLGRSAQIRDMLRIEKRLAEGHEYDEAKLLQRIIQKLDSDERAAKERRWEEVREQHISRLERKQQEEQNYLEMQIKNERIMLTRKCTEAQKIILRRCENQKADMLHAHITELHPKRLSGTTVTMPPLQLKQHQQKSEQRLRQGLPHGCPPGRVATYRGSAMLTRTQGKYPLLSLCALYDPDIQTTLTNTSGCGCSTSSPQSWASRSFATLRSPEFMTRAERSPSRKATLLFTRTLN